MTVSSNFARVLLSTVGALLFSTACLTAAVGPAVSAPSMSFVR